MERSTELHSLRKGPHYHWRKRTSTKPSPPFRKKTYQTRAFSLRTLDSRSPTSTSRHYKINSSMKWVKSSHMRLAEWLHYADSCPSSPHKVMWFENQGRTRSEGNWRLTIERFMFPVQPQFFQKAKENPSTARGRAPKLIPSLLGKALQIAIPWLTTTNFHFVSLRHHFVNGLDEILTYETWTVIS